MKTKVDDKADLPVFFHGTSGYALDQIQSGANGVRAVYTDANVSLGGAYLSVHRNIAKVAARNAAHNHDSVPVVLAVRPRTTLLPDEDWLYRPPNGHMTKD